KDSILTIDGKKGINTHGADIINTADNGLTQLRASDGSINLGTVSTATHMTAGERSDKNHWINHYQNEVGTNITAVGDINLLAGDQLNIRQSDIDSYQGNVNLYGKNSVNISEGRQQTELDHSTYDKSSGFLSKKTTLDQYQANYNEAVASNITGAKVKISSDKDINIRGSNIISDNGTLLHAGNDINISAAENHYTDRQYHKETKSGLMGSGGIGFTIGSQKESDDTTSQSLIHSGSSIGSLSGNTSLISGGATNIKGAQVTGKGVSIDAAELNIESLQDTAKYDSKQENISGQVTVGYGASGSVNYSKSKIKADYAGVTEQSGIIAGDNGYQIKVKGNTDLKGAIITSTQAAEAAGKNQLITGSLTSSDIKNHSDYKGSSIGIGVSGNYGGGWTGQSKDGVNKSLGFGHDSGHDSSTTHSGINTNNIIITDETAQQQKTGKNAAQTIAGIHP
ncbi:hemagglutinin repeat-containing protein, partial [Snodgrassella sp.]|uniref:hemagglutinin repeat-containing protein n=1 Tax=Snodgrassella sp. TaxID=2815304 RepID=UPI002590F0E7